MPLYNRKLDLPPSGDRSFFLWGPRQTGKTTLLRQHYPDARWIDLLETEVFVRYSRAPQLLRQEIAADGHDPARQVVIDEVQRVPMMLNEVHWLIENRRLKFALSGSSARKVRRGRANLLGGRALRYELRGVTAGELGDAFDLDRMLNRGYLPSVYQSQHAARMLEAYVADYLREEVTEKGLTRNLPVFARFLEVASLSDGDRVNYSSIAADCAVSRPTVRGYFEILEDTLLGSWLPAYRRRAKRRVATSPKFYFADVGVVNVLARRGNVLAGSEQYGKAFENWVHHELRAYLAFHRTLARLSFWRLANGTEVDFLLDDLSLAIEAKSTDRVNGRHLKGLRELKREHPDIQQRVVVCREPLARLNDEGILILPYQRFVERLWSGELVT